ncbi:hypothetical protein GUJ93_ZPchr0004g40395 [Zizania palustris]|uniref:Uncharacterized protein n=1 Tax=Zizania palustris TaxID=103762 RepID=A0A8J5S621_ZIZPA|nr:hypothetical protein GUJ93_ZPchr0004g40395 [Zizania palustris]
MVDLKLTSIFRVLRRTVCRMRLCKEINHRTLTLPPPMPRSPLPPTKLGTAVAVRCRELPLTGGPAALLRCAELRCRCSKFLHALCCAKTLCGKEKLACCGDKKG